nr:MAG TPA: hypothetical protein [Bacteriophage sp.]
MQGDKNLTPYPYTAQGRECAITYSNLMTYTPLSDRITSRCVPLDPLPVGG